MPKKMTLTKVSGWATLSLGAISLIFSVFFNSQILAFIGLGLTFWGIVLTYIRSEDYIKEGLLTATCLPTLETLSQLMDALGYSEKAIYLPPKYLKDPENNKAYIPKNKGSSLPTPEQIQRAGNEIFIENPQGVILTPPGSALTRLFEKTLETSFTKADPKYLQLNLPRLLIEELEIAQNLEINIESDKASIRIENTSYASLTKENKNFLNLYESVGCPIASALACALAKATGKPIIIEKQKVDEETKTIEIEFRIIKEEKI